MAEPIFQGPTALTLDTKGRLAIPARHRAALEAADIRRLTLTKNRGHSLLVFPEPVWARFRARVLALPQEAEAWKRLFIANASEVEVDGSSRVLVDGTLRKFAALDREVMLLGVGSHFELWDAAKLAAHEDELMNSPLPDSLKSFTF